MGINKETLIESVVIGCKRDSEYIENLTDVEKFHLCVQHIM